MPIVLSFAPSATVPLQVTAQAYGTDTYSSNNYNGSDAAPSTTTTGPSAPQTGFAIEQPLFTVPLLLVLAIIVGSVSFAISRYLRRRRQK